MGHLEGNFTPVLYMGRKVPKGQYKVFPLGLKLALHSFHS